MPDAPRRQWPGGLRQPLPRAMLALRWVALAGLTMGFAGCETLQSATNAISPPASEQESIPAQPSAHHPARPQKHWLRVGSYVMYSEMPLDAADPLFRELEQLPDQIQHELALPPSESLVQVFLFENQEKYEAFLQARYPRLPARRAYFIAEPRTGAGDDLLVFTWLGENLRTDLRHELTHATLHGICKGVPLWLDEGLASYFELPPNHHGVNPQHLDTLRRGPFLPELTRLEKFGQVRQMEKPEYREAWAWVHLMLRGRPETRKILLDYMQELRKNANPGAIYPRLRELYEDPNAALAEHLTRTEFHPPMVTNPPRSAAR
ncbi:MAG: hypothetical protein ACRCZF_26840 [Gemmataceae bacterium]